MSSKAAEPARIDQEYAAKNIRMLRVWLPVVSALILACGFWDYSVSPSTIQETLLLRAGITLTLMVTWGASFHPGFGRFYDWIIGASGSLAMLGLAWIMLYLPFGMETSTATLLVCWVCASTAGVRPVPSAIFVALVIFAQVFLLDSYGAPPLLLAGHAQLLAIAGGFVVMRAQMNRRSFEVDRQLAVEREEGVKLRESAAAAQQKRLSWLESMAQFLRHELNNPLVGVESSVKLLAEMPATQIPKYAARAQKSADVMRRLLASATEATDLESALEHDQFHTVDLSSLLHERLESFADECPDRKVLVGVAPGQRIAGDEVRLLQLVDKLLANAQEHSRPGDEIRVSLSTIGKAVELRVENDGDPLPPETERLFELFVSVGKSTSRPLSRGLGLYVVRRIAERHGAQVVAQNCETKPGASFRVSFPTLRQEASSEVQT